MAGRNKRIATRYARALLQVAIERELEEVLCNDMQLIASTVGNNNELKRLLENPVVKNHTKIKVFNAIFEKHVSPLAISFFDIVIEKRREDILPSLAEEYIELYKEHAGITKATVVTPVPISESLRQLLITKLKSFTQNRIELEETVNPRLIGGYRLQVDDYRYDCSIEEKLKNLSKEFEKNIYEKEY
jgi:F-type H+-transporting ATPase subunit delta